MYILPCLYIYYLRLHTRPVRSNLDGSEFYKVRKGQFPEKSYFLVAVNVVDSLPSVQRYECWYKMHAVTIENSSNFGQELSKVE